MRHIPSTFKLDLESSNQIGSVGSVDSSCQPHQTVFEQDANRFLCRKRYGNWMVVKMLFQLAVKEMIVWLRELQFQTTAV